LSRLESHLPIKYAALSRPAGKRWISPYFQFIWSADPSVASEPAGLVFVPPNTPVEAPNNPGTLISLRFHSDFLASLEEVKRLGRSLRVPLSDRVKKLLEFAAMLPEDAASSAAIHLSCSATLILAEMLACIDRGEMAFGSSPAGGKPVVLMNGRSLIRAVRFMRQNMSNPQLSLNDIAGAIGYSPNYFCSEFSKVFDASPIRFLNQLRLRQALKLLETSEWTVEAICRSVGIAKPSRLSSMIRAVSGLTPTAFRRAKKQQRTG